MKFTFNINYKLRPGQRLHVTSTLPGAEDITLDGIGDTHTARHTLSPKVPTQFRYRYYITADTDETFYEAGEPRLIELSPEAGTVLFNDSWQGNTEDAPLLTAPFANILYTHGASDTPTLIQNEHLIIRVTVPAVEKDHNIHLCGDAAILGSWEPSRSIRMTPVSGSRWEARIPLNKLPRQIQFKFLKIKAASRGGKTILWEECDNRQIDIPAALKNTTLLVEYSAAALPTPHPRLFGTAIPVFSLRSRRSSGIGQFTDLKLLCDWAAKTGQHAIQLLPVNDTTATRTWRDSYPYSPISVIALHPIYLDVQEAGQIKDKTQAAAFEKERKRLNDLPAVDYKGVLRFKTRYIENLFDQDGQSTQASQEYQQFINENAEWLPSYAIFCALRDHFGTSDFTAWGKYARYTPDIIKELDTPRSFAARSIAITKFTQYHLFRQLTDAVRYAHSHDILLKGDIPIGITLYSVGTWCFPKLFNSDSQTGAPPDFFSADGQNWGFPTYNWDEMAKDHYTWWKARLIKMSKFFDAYRIDHVLGFFRIWEIPRPQVSGKLGHFSPSLPYTREQLRNIPGIDPDTLIKKKLLIPDPHRRGYYHPIINPQGASTFDTLSQEEKNAYLAFHYDYFHLRHNDFWRINAYKKLPELISATPMLTCAEDLGMIPDCVPEVMSSLKILSLQIFRMPKASWGRFDDPRHYPYLSVCTTGSHDTTTIRGWWEEDRAAAEDYYYNVLHAEGECPQTCEPWICEQIIRSHTRSSSMLTILPLQDWLSIDPDQRIPDPASERINDPANPHHYWRYRMHITLESLNSQQNLNQRLMTIINNTQ